MSAAHEDLQVIAEVTAWLNAATTAEVRPYGEDIAEALEGLSAVQDHIHSARLRVGRRAAA